jgi:ankyrin repeat protein
MNAQRSRIRLTSVSMVMLVALACSSVACHDGNHDVGGSGEIFEAARYADPGKVTALLKSNPKLILSKDHDGWTLLHWAAYEGDKNLVQFLLANGADVNAQDFQFRWAPLHYAAEEGHKDVAELLLASKADINLKTKAGATPLHWAVAHMDVVELLLYNDASVNAKDNAGKTPLHYAALNGYKDVMQLLRQHGGQE